MTHTDPQPIGLEVRAPTLRQTLGRRAPRATDRTVAAIAECLEPDFPRLDPATRAVVLADVTAFAVAQVGALPDFLRYPYRLALVAFEWLAVLRFGQRFVALDAERQRAWVALWAESPLGVTRNFVKLIRSCALLAFYDHPAVQEPLNRQVRRTTERASAGPDALGTARPAPHVSALS